MLKGFKSEQFRVRPKQKSPLRNHPTRIEPFYNDDPRYDDVLNELREELSEQQELLHAQNEYSLLIILQGMDTSGKDGLIKHVFSGVNPQGCVVTSFKRPTSLELSHDFLWRTNLALPTRGQIGIFNRSYYEDVIVIRVHPELLENSQIPVPLRKNKSIWRDRFQDIVNHEQYLSRQGTRIVKFYLHLSKEEQRKRLLARIDDPEKHWKFDTADFRERQFWSTYQNAYNDCLASTSTKECPWHVIPADDKKNARLIVSQILVETLHSLKLKFPIVRKPVEKELQRIHSALSREKGQAKGKKKGTGKRN